MTNIYSLKGELLTNFGARVYPVAYVHDAQGRRTNMITWNNFAARTGVAITRWIFNDRGFLTAKVYDDSRGTTNTYTPAGRPRTRVWARGITTTYETNAAGQVFATVYSDGTPAVTNYFDRLGRVTNIVSGTESQFLTYSESGRVLLETNTSGPLAGFSLAHGYDSLLRRTSLTVRSNTTALYSPTYAYDSRSSRLTNAVDGAYSATYDYLANSPMVSQITFRSNSVTAMTTTKQYDYLNRLLRISSVPSADTAVSFDYLYNDANQRTRRTDPDGSYWLYEYDKLGQLASGKHYWPDGTPVAGQQFEYAYDDIGNRTSTKEGGDATGAGLRSATYGANALNQYTNRTIPAAADVLGIAHASSTVTVNDQTPYRKGEYFWKELSINNASAAIWQGVTNIAWLTGTTNTNTGSIFLPKTPEVFSHDADGNLTNDGRFFYTWDAENRMLKAEGLSSSPTSSKRKVEWAFDPKGRRVRQITSDGSSGSYVVTEDLKFVYDGWACAAELNATNNTLIRTYLWGLDLSGSMVGAGGVGGLLAMNSTISGASFHGYDGNGNVVTLVSSAGAKPASYEYDPFGRTLRSSGTPANDNSYRFSTKRVDASTDFALYEYRTYSPSVGRWLSRDPIGEVGGQNVYGCVRNDAISKLDRLGLACLDRDCLKRPRHCPRSCEVVAIAMIPKWWTLNGGDAFLTFDVDITFRSGPAYACYCCKYIQWLRGTATYNGIEIPEITGEPPDFRGTPLDGEYHIDSSDYTDDSDVNPRGSAYNDADPDPCRFHSTDTPGFSNGGVITGTSINLTFTFLGNVIDICNNNVVVAGATLSMSMSGTYPALTVSPQVP